MIRTAALCALIAAAGATQAEPFAPEQIGAFCSRAQHRAALDDGVITRATPSPFNGVRLAIDATLGAAHSCAFDTAPQISYWRSYYGYLGCAADSEAGAAIERYMAATLDDQSKAGAFVDPFRRVFLGNVCQRLATCIPVSRFRPEHAEVDLACWRGAIIGDSNWPLAPYPDPPPDRGPRPPPADAAPRTLHAR